MPATGSKECLLGFERLMRADLPQARVQIGSDYGPVADRWNESGEPQKPRLRPSASQLSSQRPRKHLPRNVRYGAAPVVA
jgi:hypothetical protein